MRLAERIELINAAPAPVRFAVKTAGTIAWAGYKVCEPLVSLLPRKYQTKWLGTESAIKNTKRTAFLELGAGVAASYFIGDNLAESILSSYLVFDGAWRYTRASESFQRFSKALEPFTYFFHARTPAPRGTLAVELSAAALERLLD
ncbi:hypothetical protein HYU16_01485 [Candidatus Woesearchaeota archaeon]|nr:hypothetical protein [Candidatus Woesearchaeota archaeon]